MENEFDSVILGIDPGTNLLGYGILGKKGNKAYLVTMGVIDLRKCKDVYTKLGRIYERVSGLINSFHPEEMAIEAPFFGKNVQSMLKLGRAQGVAIAAAISQQVTVHEYAPMKIKLALTGKGSASKAQVSYMLQRIFNINSETLVPYMDATDALAAAYCHFLQKGKPDEKKSYSSWNDFVQKNSARVSKPTTTKQ